MIRPNLFAQLPAVIVAMTMTMTMACSTAGNPAGDDAGTTPDNTTDASTPQCTQNIHCNDNNPCTEDVCTDAQVCAYNANTSDCDDNNSCTQGDVCANSVCVSGANSCACTNTADCAPFEDNDLCNGTLICTSANVCEPDPSTVVSCSDSGDTECRKNECNSATGNCGMADVGPGTACTGSDACAVGRTCQSGTCQGGSEVCCADNMNNDGDGQTDCDDSDCSATAACQCQAVVPADESPLPVESITNAVTSTTANGYSDEYIYNQAGTRKLGVRQNWGGSIVFFGIDNGSAGVNNTNTIDGNDTGREVQIALYDHDRWYQGCAWNASCSSTTTTCEQSMTYFGWNPVQGGNRCNNGSGIDSSTSSDGALTIETTPLYWNPNWDRQDCSSAACGIASVESRPSDVELTQRVRFVRPDVVELSYTLTNTGPIDHASAPHEFPTLYASFGKDGRPDLYRLFDSTSNEITTGWNVDIHGFRYQNFSSSGGWASLQNQNADYGVGLFYESGMGTFQAWNKAASPKFNNFRGLFSFPIPAFGQVRARSYLILGSIGGVASESNWLDTNLPPFGSLDSPAEGDTVSGTVSVHGWSMDNKGVTQVQMIIDGGAPVTLNYGASRADVCRVWPGYPACSHGNVGYQGSFNTSSLTPSTCGHVIEIRATDTHGNQRIIARKRFYQ